MTREEVLDALSPLLARLASLDADDPAGASLALAGFDVSGIEATLRAAHAEGWLTPKESGGVRWGRLSRAAPETHGFSVDIVEMDGAAAGPHTHPSGEFDLCFALDGQPRFDGRAPGWVVYPPGSRHVPTVHGGRMLIAYFLPQGAIQFEPGR